MPERKMIPILQTCQKGELLTAPWTCASFSEQINASLVIYIYNDGRGCRFYHPPVCRKYKAWGNDEQRNREEQKMKQREKYTRKEKWEMKMKRKWNESETNRNEWEMKEKCILHL